MTLGGDVTVSFYMPYIPSGSIKATTTAQVFHSVCRILSSIGNARGFKLNVVLIRRSKERSYEQGGETAPRARYLQGLLTTNLSV